LRAEKKPHQSERHLDRTFTQNTPFHKRGTRFIH
jgi:hypothetical protein